MKTSTTFNRLVSIITFASAFCISSCSQTTAPQVFVSNVHILKTGDSFTFHDHATDTSGVLSPGSDTIVAAVVAETGLSVAGKNNVAKIIKGSDTTYIAEATDSSFSLLQNQVGIISGISIPPVWVTFDPAKNGKTVYDSTQNAMISGMPAKIRETIVINYSGKDAVMIGGNTLTVYKFSKIVSVIVTVYGQDYTTTVTVMNNYAPSIGYLAQHNAKTISDSQNSPVPNGITYSILQSYQIR